MKEMFRATTRFRRIAVLCDIRGNLPALEAVLAEVDSADADLIVDNGDAASGPMPAETLDRLIGIGDRVVRVRGDAVAVASMRFACPWTTWRNA